MGSGWGIGVFVFTLGFAVLLVLSGEVDLIAVVGGGLTEPLLMGFLGGLCGSIPLAVVLFRVYFSLKVTAFKKVVDRLVMPLTREDWKAYELKFYEFRELIYADSRDFLSGR